ncbi:MAG: hypothetical protein LC797_19520, partial [Chloroflexi bacterium]|nr:hypothetical protein [Chloroflexota bacterium]
TLSITNEIIDNHYRGSRPMSAVTNTRRPHVGDRMPELILRGLDGQPFSLQSLRGKRALIFMWASW